MRTATAPQVSERKGGLLERPWFHGLTLALLVVLGNLQFFRHDFFPVQDTAQLYLLFHPFYVDMAVFHEWMRWFPFGFGGGIQTDIYQVLLTPARNLLILLSPLLPFKSTLTAYYVSLLIEQAMFVGGLYLFACRLCERPLARLFVGIAGACTIFLNIQLINFLTYYWVPLWLYFLDRFLEERRAWRLWMAGLLMLVSLYLSYMEAVYLLMFLTFLAVRIDRPSVFFRDIRQFKLLEWRSLTALGLALAFAGIYGAFLGHATNFLLNYSPGRDPKTLLPSLEVFLTWGQPSFSKFLELFYAAPQDGNLDIMIYIGYIPLALLLAQLMVWPRNRWAGALWAGAAVLALLSIANMSFVAPLFFQLFPLGAYFRHLYFVLPIVKLLLLLLAGIGLDEQLSTDDWAPARHEAFRRACLILFLGIAALDVLWLRGDLPYPIRYPSFYLMPYGWFHFLPLAILGVLLLRLSGAERLSQASRGAWIVGCFLVEILSYQHFLLLAAPTRIGPVPPEVFSVRPPAFAAQRIPDRTRASGPAGAAAPTFLNRWGAHYAFLDEFLGVEVCDQFLRTDLNNLGIDRMIRARVGAPLDGPVDAVSPRARALPGNHVLVPPGDDPSLQRSFGCLWPKVRLVGQTVVAKDMDDEARLIRLSPNLESTAIIRPGDAHGPWPHENGALGSATMTSFTANSLGVDAEVKAKKAWLVYSDGYNPGWTATVNGKPAEVHEVNLGFKGVLLDAGRSSVEFVYTGGRSRWLGPLLGALSALGCVATACWLVFALAAEVRNQA